MSSNKRSASISSLVGYFTLISGTFFLSRTEHLDDTAKFFADLDWKAVPSVQTWNTAMDSIDAVDYPGFYSSLMQDVQTPEYWQDLDKKVLSMPQDEAYYYLGSLLFVLGTLGILWRGKTPEENRLAEDIKRKEDLVAFKSELVDKEHAKYQNALQDYEDLEAAYKKLEVAYEELESQKPASVKDFRALEERLQAMLESLNPEILERFGERVTQIETLAQVKGANIAAPLSGHKVESLAGEAAVQAALSELISLSDRLSELTDEYYYDELDGIDDWNAEFDTEIKKLQVANFYNLTIESYDPVKFIEGVKDEFQGIEERLKEVIINNDRDEDGVSDYDEILSQMRGAMHCLETAAKNIFVDPSKTQKQSIVADNTGDSEVIEIALEDNAADKIAAFREKLSSAADACSVMHEALEDELGGGWNECVSDYIEPLEKALRELKIADLEGLEGEILTEFLTLEAFNHGVSVVEEKVRKLIADTDDEEEVEQIMGALPQLRQAVRELKAAALSLQPENIVIEPVVEPTSSEVSEVNEAIEEPVTELTFQERFEDLKGPVTQIMQSMKTQTRGSHVTDGLQAAYKTFDWHVDVLLERSIDSINVEHLTNVTKAVSELKGKVRTGFHEDWQGDNFLHSMRSFVKAYQPVVELVIERRPKPNADLVYQLTPNV